MKNRHGNQTKLFLQLDEVRGEMEVEVGIGESQQISALYDLYMIRTSLGGY